MSDDIDLRFEWDDRKAAANLKKHGVSFEAASFVFDDPMRLEESDVFAHGEYRTLVTGLVNDVLLSVVYAEPEEDLVRIISARRATAAERKAYDQNVLYP